jgi:membrane associated rhomboid family serine protease
MGFVIAFGGLVRVAAVTAIVAVVGGLGTWLVAPASTIHIGASGIVFGYGTYLISRGFFDRNAVDIAIGVVVAVVWGGALLGGLLPQDGISWQGHLFGAIGGILAGRVLAPPRERLAPRSASG